MLRAIALASLFALTAFANPDEEHYVPLCGYAFDDRVAPAKQSYSSADGDLTLSVEESRGMRMTAQSASRLVLERQTPRGSKRVYRVTLDFAVTHAAVAADGRVTVTGVGKAKQYGFEGEQTLLAFFDEAGEVIALHTQPRGSNGGWQRNTTANFGAVEVLQAGVLVQVQLNSDQASFREWRVYDSAGTLRGTVDTRQLMSTYATQSFVMQLAVMPGTDWVVSVWWDTGRQGVETLSYIVAVHDLGRCFAEGDKPAQREPVWMTRFEEGSGWPRLGLIDAAEGGGVSFTFIERGEEPHAHHFRRTLVGELVVETL